MIGAKPRPECVQAIEVVLTAGCNLSCSYCYQRQRPSGRLDWPTLREAIDLIVASENRRVSIGFCGGEPLLEMPMLRRAVEYAEANRRPGQEVLYSLITNGTLLRPDNAAFLAARRVQTQLSFDGIAPAQDLRQKGSFERLDGLLDRLREEQPTFYQKDLSISLTVLPATLRHLAESIHYFYDKSIRNVVLSPLFTCSTEWLSEQLSELDQVFHRISEISIEHFRHTGQVPLGVLRARPKEAREPPNTREVCSVGGCKALAVDTNGQIYGCVLLAESLQDFPSEFLRNRIRTLRLGRLQDAGFRDRLAAYPEAVRAAEIFDHLEEKHSSYGSCCECECLADCQICPLAIGHIPGNNDPRRIPDFLCAFNKVTHRYRKLFQRRVRKFRKSDGSSDAGNAESSLHPALEELKRSRHRREALQAQLRTTTGDQATVTSSHR